MPRLPILVRLAVIALSCSLLPAFATPAAAATTAAAATSAKATAKALAKTRARCNARAEGKSKRIKAARARRCRALTVRVQAAGAKHTPDTTITAGPATGSTTTSTAATFSFTSDTSRSSFSCSLDGATYAACTSPWSAAGLAAGSHTFRVRATAAGRTDASPASRTWTVTGEPTPAPAPAPAPEPVPAPAPAQPSAQPRTTWTPVGSTPLSDAEAAARVTRVAEIRPQNAEANRYVPTATEIAGYHNARTQYGQTNLEVSPLTKYVTGRSGLTNPSTDDLIQWTAHKWGIPEDWIRAQMAHESWWNHAAIADRATVDPVWYLLYPAVARIPGTTDVLQSMGVMQVKWIPDGSVGAGTEPLRWKSVAFNLDYYGAVTRFYFDGYCGWCTSGYVAGQEWASIGAWYSPYPWNNTDAQNYVAKVKGYLAERIWTKAGF